MRLQFGSAAPASGIDNAKPKLQKQMFFKGNYEKPYDIWAHDEGGKRRSESKQILAQP